MWLRSPDYVQFLLRHLKCELAVHVREAPTEIGCFDESGGSAESTEWISSVHVYRPAPLGRHHGFPPLVRLKFGSQSGELDSVQVTWPPGRPPVVISRRENVTYEQRELCRGDVVESPPTFLVESTLARMAGRGLAARQNLEHDFVDAATFTQAVIAARDKQVGDLDTLLASLRAQLWLRPADLPGFRLPLELKIRDARGDKTVPLPELPPIPPPAGAGAVR